MKLLTDKQKSFLEGLPQELLNHFYLTGGTALSVFYLEHRISEDLDLFTEKEENFPSLEFLIRVLKGLPSVKDVHYARLYDRRMFTLQYEDASVLKVELTLYPFKSLTERTRIQNLTVDSLLNIITGKILAILERYDPKDFVDIYFFLKTHSSNVKDLLAATEERFGIKGVKYGFAEQLLSVKKVREKDLPVMLKPISLEEMKEFLIRTAKQTVKGAPEE